MFKFITGRKGYTLERAKTVKELFAFSRTVSHGFPHSPSSLAYDEELSLMCICTKHGAVRVYGAPGVEFVGYHPQESPVIQVHFVPGQGRLITAQENNELTLWEIVDTQLEIVETINNFEKRIFSVCVSPNKKQVLLGTEHGDIYVVDLETFKFTDLVVQRDLITEKVPEDFKVSPGGVECLRYLNQDHCIVGYQRGILVLFDLNKLSARQTYISRKDLSSIYVVDESKFVSCHTDGGYAVWSTILSSSTKQVDQIYGPHHCKSVDKLFAFDNERTLIFSGGMPRAQYGDRYTLSIHRGPIERKVFEFTSKVLDFFIVSKKVVIVLAEEEVVAISLQDLKPLALPYLFPLHCSAITNVLHASGVRGEIVTKLTDEVAQNEYSCTKWPIQGGKLEKLVDSKSDKFDLILTGHEDGSVRIYDASGVVLKLLSCIKTSSVFNERCHDASRLMDQDDDEFLQFTRVCSFDPYSDDPRFAVKKLAFNSATGTLVVGGTAGQVLVLGLEVKSDVKVTSLNLVGDRDHFVWKGHDTLTHDPDTILKSRYQVSHIVQVKPPASVTALALNEKWNLISIGTAHGFGCADLSSDQIVMFKCTLNETDHGGAGAHSGDMVRRKSFKKSLRESFRRLRKGRSQRGKTAKNLEEIKPVERQVEFRIVQDDGLSSMVRSLLFSDAYILSHSSTSRTFWASTNSGAVFIYALKKTEDSLAMSLCKEIHLKHHAPVLGVFVVDSHGFLCHDVLPKESAIPNLWRVVICSEEQIKVFSLPQLKPLHKVKLTANEGSRIRKLQVAEFRNSERNEFGLITMTNQGQIIVFSLPDLRRIITADCCRKDDINGISSAVFTPFGEGFYLNSASEFDRVSVSATKITAPCVTVELADGARPMRRTSMKKKKDDTVESKEVSKERQNSTPEKEKSTISPEKLKTASTSRTPETKETTPKRKLSSSTSPEKKVDLQTTAKNAPDVEHGEIEGPVLPISSRPSQKSPIKKTPTKEKTSPKKTKKGKEKPKQLKVKEMSQSETANKGIEEETQDIEGSKSVLMKKKCVNEVEKNEIDVTPEKQGETAASSKQGVKEEDSKEAKVISILETSIAANESTVEPREVEVKDKTDDSKQSENTTQMKGNQLNEKSISKKNRKNSRKNSAAKKKDNNSNNFIESRTGNGKDNETTVHVNETHEKKEKKTRSVEKFDDGNAEKKLQTEQVDERKITQQLEEGNGFKVETTEVVVTKKAVVVSEETRIINGSGADTLGKLEVLTKSLQLDEILAEKQQN